MATIKSGFGEKPLSIRFEVHQTTLDAGVWVEQEGLNTGAEKVIQRYETLSYATLEELVTLRDELNRVIGEIVGV